MLSKEGVSLAGGDKGVARPSAGGGANERAVDEGLEIVIDR